MSVGYRAVDWSFSVHADQQPVQAQLARALVDLEVPGSADHAYRLRSPSTGSAGLLTVDDEPLLSSHDEALLYATLLWHVNRGVVQTGAKHVLVHASAAVSPRGEGVLMAAPMESGKTTLVAGLLRAGWSYLTDEAVALDAETLAVTPYWKPLSIDDGSWDVLADLAPQLPADAAHLCHEQWQVPASDIGGGGLSPGGQPPAHVVLPRYEAGAPTRLEPLRPSEAAIALLHSTFEPDRSAARDFRSLTQLARSATCHRLVSGDLDEAVAAVSSLVRH